jgi:hypothetical protein
MIRKRWVITAIARESNWNGPATNGDVMAARFNGDWDKRTFYTKVGARRAADDYRRGFRAHLRFSVRRIQTGRR